MILNAFIVLQARLGSQDALCDVSQVSRELPRLALRPLTLSLVHQPSPNPTEPHGGQGAKNVSVKSWGMHNTMYVTRNQAQVHQQKDPSFPKLMRRFSEAPQLQLHSYIIPSMPTWFSLEPATK